jgi:hypothetical protein
MGYSVFGIRNDVNRLENPIEWTAIILSSTVILSHLIALILSFRYVQKFQRHQTTGFVKILIGFSFLEAVLILIYNCLDTPPIISHVYAYMAQLLVFSIVSISLQILKVLIPLSTYLTTSRISTIQYTMVLLHIITFFPGYFLFGYIESQRIPEWIRATNYLGQYIGYGACSLIDIGQSLYVTFLISRYLATKSRGDQSRSSKKLKRYRWIVLVVLIIDWIGIGLYIFGTAPPINHIGGLSLNIHVLFVSYSFYFLLDITVESIQTTQGTVVSRTLQVIMVNDDEKKRNLSSTLEMKSIKGSSTKSDKETQKNILHSN